MSDRHTHVIASGYDVVIHRGPSPPLTLCVELDPPRNVLAVVDGDLLTVGDQDGPPLFRLRHEGIDRVHYIELLGEVRTCSAQERITEFSEPDDSGDSDRDTFDRFVQPPKR